VQPNYKHFQVRASRKAKENRALPEGGGLKRACSPTTNIFRAFPGRKRTVRQGHWLGVPSTPLTPNPSPTAAEGRFVYFSPLSLNGRGE
jgi:hypothetical protein